ncbi:MAG: endolytic transglycosylase MltG, partial [Syntrophobacteria bacterium]
TPASSEPAEVVVEVPVGMSVPALSELLHGQGLVRSAGKFRWLVRFKGAARQIKAGEYQLSTGLRPGELLNKIIRGEVRLHQITFPEGYTLKQMAELLEASKLVNAERFIAAATDPPFVRSLDIPATSLEGYLFPDTYRFARGLPVKTVLRSFLTMFNQHFGPVQEEQARKLGFTRHQVVILASVVEKETAAAEERPLIAGVFLNRLRRRVRLQSDPTVIYGLRNFDGNLTRAHLQKDTPYNTYTRRGLPIGPICNPGAASIQAVLNPTSTPYLYFVAKKDGTHHFSTNLVEHNAAVLRHQKRR